MLGNVYLLWERLCYQKLSLSDIVLQSNVFGTVMPFLCQSQTPLTRGELFKKLRKSAGRDTVYLTTTAPHTQCAAVLLQARDSDNASIEERKKENSRNNRRENQKRKRDKDTTTRKERTREIVREKNQKDRHRIERERHSYWQHDHLLN